jgi:hypothetical protein
LGRTEMSKRELGRVEVLARVRSRELRVVDAAALLQLSYRQAKRLWKRYREEGATGLRHRSAGRRSNRAYPERLRRKVLGLVREKYGGAVGERFGPTLAAVRPPRGGEARAGRASGRGAAVVGLALRFALQAPQGSAAGKANDTRSARTKTKKGTLLRR